MFLQDELTDHTPCRHGSITQRIYMPLPSGLGLESLPEPVGGDGIIYPAAVIYTAAMCIQEVFDVVQISASGMEINVENILSVTAMCCQKQGRSQTQEFSTPNAGKGDVRIISDSSKCSAKEEADGRGANEAAASIVALRIEWIASPLSDMIADCVISTITQALSAPAMLIAAASSQSRKIITDPVSSMQMNGVESTPGIQTGQKSDELKPPVGASVDALVGSCGESSSEHIAMTINNSIFHDRNAVLTADHDAIVGSQSDIVRRMKLGLVDPRRDIRHLGNRASKVQAENTKLHSNKRLKMSREGDNAGIDILRRRRLERVCSAILQLPRGKQVFT